MKKYTLAIIMLAGFWLVGVHAANAQSDPASFTGALAKKKHYDALYYLNSNDEKKIRATLRNINNALDDPRLKGKIHIELVAFGDGVAVFMKDGPFGQLLQDLQTKGVVLAQCMNTLRERKIDTSELFPFISFVPSGNGEIILRQYVGWAVVHP